MSKLPKHIRQALLKNETSLGDHPCYPPEEEERFVVKLLSKTFDNMVEKSDMEGGPEMKLTLSKLISECMKIESKNKGALEQLCLNVVNNVFTIPQDTIDISAKLVAKVDTSNHRDVPESTEDFTFDDIEDMRGLTDEVYKRRILDALIAGASMYYANDVTNYVSELYKIDPKLPFLYSKILQYNDILLYTEKDSLSNKNGVNGGKVDVTLGSPDKMVSIKAEGIIFPVLLEETIKGVLEIAISHGLPSDIKKAEYVSKKADFKLAENWDMRLGLPLWAIIAKQIEETEEEIEPNLFLMKLAELPVSEFNNALQEIFAKTKRGKQKVADIVNEINHELDQEDFDDYVYQQNQKYPIEDGYFSSEELLTDDEDNF